MCCRAASGKQIRIALQRTADDQLAILFKVVLEGVQGVLERREVEAQDDVAMAVFGRLPPQVGAAEDLLEVVRLSCGCSSCPAATPSRTCQSAADVSERRSVRLLKRGRSASYRRRASHSRADALEIGLSVGNARVRCSHDDSYNEGTRLSVTIKQNKRNVLTIGRPRPTNSAVPQVLGSRSTPMSEIDDQDWVPCCVSCNRYANPTRLNSLGAKPLRPRGR